MKTEHIKISNDGTGMNEALNLTDSLAVSLKLSKKQSFHLRLLAEEMFSMVRAIAGNFNADFWIEENDRNCQLHLETAKMQLDYEKRREFLSVSTTGKNIASRGIMEKIRDIFEAGLYGMEESLKLQSEYGGGLSLYGAMDNLGTMDVGLADAIYSWSMQKYKSEIEAERSDNPDEWDEIEKSIIANIADDVKVGVRKDSLGIIIEKKF